MKEEQPVPSEYNIVVSSTGYSAETWALLYTLSVTLTIEAGRANCEDMSKKDKQRAGPFGAQVSWLPLLIPPQQTTLIHSVV